MTTDRRSFLQLAAAVAATPPGALAFGQQPAPGTGTASQPASGTGSSSDRRRLESMADRYLAALVARDPAKAPFAEGAVFAENDQRLNLGEASWRTIDGLGRYRHYFADPERNEVGVIANASENGAGCILILRLSIRNERITEAEQFVIRDPVGARLYEELGTPDPVWLEPVPPEIRQAREALEAAAWMYFQALERNDGAGIYPFRDDCERIEHARPTVNRPAVERYGHADTRVDFVTLKAKQQYELGMMAFVSRVRDRRVLVVDVERGAVLGQSCFDFDGTLRTIHFAGGGDWAIPPYFRTPRTHQMNEAFKVLNGAFRYIEMTLLEVPFATRPVWPGRLQTVRLDYDRTAPAPQPIAVTDHNGLRALTEQVVDAIIADCPCRVPFAGTVRYTENGVAAKLGEGLWKTAVGRRGFAVTLADPATGQAGWMGTLDEYGLFALMALRLRLQGGLISELEVIIARPQAPSRSGDLAGATATMFTPPLIADLDPDGFTQPDPALGRPAAAVRGELTGVVDRYFRAYMGRTSADVRFAPGCRLRENGVAASGNRNGSVVDPARPEFRLFARDCAGEIDAGYRAALTRLLERRDLVVDEMQGQVLHLGLVDNPATIRSVAVPGVGEVAAAEAFRIPWTDLHVQLFKVDSGAIAHIEGLVRRLPYGQGSGWSSS